MFNTNILKYMVLFWNQNCFGNFPLFSTANCYLLLLKSFNVKFCYALNCICTCATTLTINVVLDNNSLGIILSALTRIGTDIHQTRLRPFPDIQRIIFLFNLRHYTGRTNKTITANYSVYMCDLILGHNKRYPEPCVVRIFRHLPVVWKLFKPDSCQYLNGILSDSFDAL